ncbi:Glucosamine-1-phosphate N-acetyltransferase [Dictyoglomus turgidum DSM 6724]|jgi:bifunctional UDP-N-acetylglucosamine pyrophosphorylase/glucosamine-1-phosphate N-acetyltransferase|uniref:Glucosamine-1-phosphate N-acetyltransferase n=2 Tax=Dictyoglomaceae TaxID=203488 RepID=B8DZY0_DICTD|nr:Glucosamine-1-phosphate N-acetyltransferase [Dictyoglomus turgidum DSM 6724]HBU32294.1 GcaD protein [Dictyoglomus sp.]
MFMNDFKAIILAAGQGKRMKTDLPKVLHPLYENTLLEFLLETVKTVFEKEYILVVSPKVRTYLNSISEENVVIQDVPLGTGDAVKRLENWLDAYEGDVLILPGDMPLIKSETLIKICNVHRENNNICTLVTTFLDNPCGYGRVVRDKSGEVLKIVEEKDATEEEKKIKEINTSVYAFKWRELREVLQLLKNDNAQGEFYLTDVIEIFNKRNLKIGTVVVDPVEVLGANTQEELSTLRKILKERINKINMNNGVIIIDPDTVIIGHKVSIEKDVIIQPEVFILGNYVIKKNSYIGPLSYINSKTE